MSIFINILISTILLIPSVQGEAIRLNKGLERTDTNLTDEEHIIAKEFVHHGMIDRELAEKCGESKQMQKACKGRDIDPKVMGMSASMVNGLSKAYALIMGMGAGGDLKMVKTPKSASGVSEKKANNSDYCKYIAMGTETIATFQQTLSQDNLNKLPTNQATAQKDNLYKAAKSHDSRAKQAKLQTIGWGTTTGCYAAMLARPSVQTFAWQNLLKLGAAGLLTGFHYAQMAEQQKYADKVREIADGLPGKGDCNPITQAKCFCAQEETKHNPRFCILGSDNQYVAIEELKASCLDDTLKADPKCNCKSTNTCFDTIFDQQIIGLNLGQAFQDNVADPFKRISRAELKGGSVKGVAKRIAAATKRKLKKIFSKAPRSNVSLSKSQRDEARDLNKMGLPGILAEKLASLPITQDAKNSSDKFSGGNFGNYDLANYGRKNKKSRALYFRGGSGIGSKKKKRSRKNPYAKLKKSKKNMNNSKVLRFAKRATAAAEISTRDDINIFTLISNRYRVSALKKLHFKSLKDLK